MSSRLMHTHVQPDISGSREGPYYCSIHSEGRAHSPDSWCTSDRVECRLEPRPCPQPDTATSADNSIHTVTQSANQSTNHPINKSVNQSISQSAKCFCRQSTGLLHINNYKASNGRPRLLQQNMLP